MSRDNLFPMRYILKINTNINDFFRLVKIFKDYFTKIPKFNYLLSVKKQLFD